MKEQQKITRETGIAEALAINPEAAEILMEAGLGCIGCMFSQAENLEQGLSAHGFSEKEINEIVNLLNE